MRNLGPAVEKDLAAAGVTDPRQVHKLGAERSFVKMLEGRLKTGRSAKCCNALYLYAFYGAIHDLDWRAIPDEKKREFRRFTAELRQSGKYRVKS